MKIRYPWPAHGPPPHFLDQLHIPAATRTNDGNAVCILDQRLHDRFTKAEVKIVTRPARPLGHVVVQTVQQSSIALLGFEDLEIGITTPALMETVRLILGGIVRCGIRFIRLEQLHERDIGLRNRKNQNDDQRLDPVSVTPLRVE